MNYRRKLSVLAAIGCLVPGVGDAAQFGWTSGTLSKFLTDNAENGFFLPLTQPNELTISTSGNVLADVALANQSSITAQRGSIGISPGSAITNSPTGEFFIGDLSQIFEQGDPDLSVFENEGVVMKTGGRMTTISARFVNFNGGTIHAAEDTILRLSLADIRHQSVFSGPGLIQVGGLMSGEVHSEQSLVMGSGVGNGLTEGQNAIVSGDWRWIAPITGTWTNLGVVRGNPFTASSDGVLGELRGAQFTNDGSIIGRRMSLRGNDASLAPEDQTKLVNNGVIEFGGALQSIDDIKFLASGDAMSKVVNNGTLKIIGHGLRNSVVSLGDVQFENSGTIDVAEGVVFQYGGVGARAPQTGGVFLHGTSFTGAGITRLFGTNTTTHEFSGVINSENLQLLGNPGTAFHGVGATLLGSAAWHRGALTGAWLNFATLELRASGSTFPTLSGVLTNNGIIQQFNTLNLAPAANLVNFGLIELTGGANNDIMGTTGSSLDQINNLGQFHTRSGVNNDLIDLRFVNHGLMQINSTTRLQRSELENYGIIQGTGTLQVGSGSTFQNDGTIAPGLSPGTLNISGNFSNGPNAVIEIEMASASVFDVLRITGAVQLGGTLRIKLLDGFMPELNTPFTFLRYSSFTGAFDEVLLDGFAGTQFNLSYGASGFGLGFVSIPEPVPLPPAWVLLASSLAVFKWAGRRPAGT